MKVKPWSPNLQWSGCGDRAFASQHKIQVGCMQGHYYSSKGTHVYGYNKYPRIRMNNNNIINRYIL
eukprot:1030529-Karenia_brevis.AAC.1